jgi:hypothetical protein
MGLSPRRVPASTHLQLLDEHREPEIHSQRLFEEEAEGAHPAEHEEARPSSEQSGQQVI